MRTIVSWREWWNGIETRRSGYVLRVYGQLVVVRGQFEIEQTFLRRDLRVERGSL